MKKFFSKKLLQVTEKIDERVKPSQLKDWEQQTKEAFEEEERLRIEREKEKKRKAAIKSAGTVILLAVVVYLGVVAIEQGYKTGDSLIEILAAANMVIISLMLLAYIAIQLYIQAVKEIFSWLLGMAVMFALALFAGPFLILGWLLITMAFEVIKGFVGFLFGRLLGGILNIFS